LPSPPARETDILIHAATRRFHLAGVIVGLSTIAVLTKIGGLAEKLVVAEFFGTGDAADVYFATTTIVLSLIWMVRELVNPALLPVFTASLRTGGAEPAFLFRKVFFVTAGLLTLATVMIAVFAPFLTRLLAPGFTGAKAQMTCRLLGLLTPAVLFLGLSVVTYTVLNAHRKFGAAAWPEAAFKLAVVVGLLLLLPRLGLYALAAVMGLGGLGCLTLQLARVPERGALWRRCPRATGDAAFRRTQRLMAPLVVGVLFSHLNGLVDNVLASTLPAGQLSFLGYSKKLIDALLLIGPVAVVTVIYSELSHLASAHDDRSFARLTGTAFRVLVYLSVPTAGLLVLLRQPLIGLLFQHGQFGVESTSGTSRAFLVYAGGLPIFSLEPLLVHSFFASCDTRTPIKVGILCSLTDVALALALLGRWQYLGIAWAFVAARTCKVLWLSVILNRRFAGVFGPDPARFLIRLGLSTAATWACAWLLLSLENSHSLIQTAVFDLALPTAGGILAWATSSYLLRIDEFRAVWALIRRRRAAVSTFYQGVK
jgi:putative peptidoglycan lipid II flippase